MNKKVFVYLEACNRRALDATKVIDYLSKNNYDIVDKPEHADFILLFTCATSDRDTLFSVRRVKEFQKYDAELIVAGCLPLIEPDLLNQIFDGRTLKTKYLDSELESLFPPEGNIKFNAIKEANVCFQNFNKRNPILNIKQTFERVSFIEKIYLYIESHILKSLFGKHSLLYRFYSTKRDYFYVRVSRGCMSNCSYCGIKKAIGSLKSKKISDIIKEFKQGLAKGYKIFIISSDDLGSYGLDIGNNLAELLDKITKIDGDFKIIIHSLSPRWMVRYIDDLEKIVKTNKIKSLEIPIQSGSQRILKLMRRYSDIKKIRNAFLRLKKADPSLVLNTDIIIGFPTETDEDFRKSLSFFEEVNFSSGSVIGFSCKKGTDAEKIEPKISNEEIINRMKYAKKYLKRRGYGINSLSNTYFLFGKK